MLNLLAREIKHYVSLFSQSWSAISKKSFRFQFIFVKTSNIVLAPSQGEPILWHETRDCLAKTSSNIIN